eukprot:155476-Pyramimonas_sp.AAC.1
MTFLPSLVVVSSAGRLCTVEASDWTASSWSFFALILSVHAKTCASLAFLVAYSALTSASAAFWSAASFCSRMAAVDWTCCDGVLVLASVSVLAA